MRVPSRVAITADAAIIGCGPAGCAAAIRLAAAGGRVVLFDRVSDLARKPGEIIDPSIRVPLAELGLIDSFDALDSLALAGNVTVWDDEGPVESCGMFSPHGLGALIDRRNFEEMLRSAAIGMGVEVLHLTRHLVAERKGCLWEFAGDFEPAFHVRAPLVIEATGRASGVVNRGRRRTSDRLIALLAYGSTALEIRDQRLLIEACEAGWWYAAPLPGNCAVVAFMTDPDLLPSSSADRAAYVEHQLRRTSLISLFAAEIKGEPKRVFGCAASSGIREQIHGDNWIFVGDAASTYDPLLGKGIPLALAKGTSIARLVSGGSDLPRALSAYADAEHAAFADFLADQHRTYRRAAARFRTTFWERRRTLSPGKVSRHTVDPYESP